MCQLPHARPWGAVLTVTAVLTDACNHMHAWRVWYLACVICFRRTGVEWNRSETCTTVPCVLRCCAASPQLTARPLASVTWNVSKADAALHVTVRQPVVARAASEPPPCAAADCCSARRGSKLTAIPRPSSSTLKPKDDGLIRTATRLAPAAMLLFTHASTA